MNRYSAKPKSLGANIKVELDFLIMQQKKHLKNAAGVETSFFAKKS